MDKFHSPESSFSLVLAKMMSFLSYVLLPKKTQVTWANGSFPCPMGQLDVKIGQNIIAFVVVGQVNPFIELCFVSLSSQVFQCKMNINHSYFPIQFAYIQLDSILIEMEIQSYEKMEAFYSCSDSERTTASVNIVIIELHIIIVVVL